MSENLFEIASRKKFTYKTANGLLNTEDLWDLPLTSKAKNKANLNDVARAIFADIKADGEEDFVGETSSEDTVLKQKLDIVKHIIGVKKAENAARLQAKENADKKAKILEALAELENNEIKTKSKEELLQDLAALS